MVTVTLLLKAVVYGKTKKGWAMQAEGWATVRCPDGVSLRLPAAGPLSLMAPGGCWLLG